MKPEEIGQIEARLYEIELRICDMDNDQVERAMADMAGYILALIKEIKTIKHLIGYVEHDIRIDI